MTYFISDPSCMALLIETDKLTPLIPVCSDCRFTLWKLFKLTDGEQSVICMESTVAVTLEALMSRVYGFGADMTILKRRATNHEESDIK